MHKIKFLFSSSSRIIEGERKLNNQFQESDVVNLEMRTGAGTGGDTSTYWGVEPFKGQGRPLRGGGVLKLGFVDTQRNSQDGRRNFRRREILCIRNRGTRKYSLESNPGRKNFCIF